MSKPSTLRTSTKPKPTGINRDVKSIKEVGKSESSKVKVTKAKESPSSKTVSKLKDENPKPEKVSVNKLSSKPKTETPKSVLTSSRKATTTTKQVPTKSLSSTRPNVKIKRSDAPETPPSKRVTSTKYFPSKQLYSNALKERKPVTKVEPEPKPKPTTSKPKLLEAHSPFEKIERPKTATLRKGSIVNSNIAGPDVPISETPSLTFSLENDLPKEDLYEDDFDSYESDFEAYQSSSTPSSPLSNPEIFSEDDATTTSEETNNEVITKQTLIGIEEEKMLDSGNFELPEAKHKQMLDKIQESSEQLIQDLSKNAPSNPGSLSDEGFEDGKSSIQSGHLQCINFIDAQKKWIQNKSNEKQRKRGDEILSMIQLDTYNVTLLDMPAVTYDVFITSYGKTNRMQMSTQTGDDDVSEEIQTDAIEARNKWTQFPIAFSKIDETNSNYMEIYKREFLGVGDDSIENNLNNEVNVNYKRLETFLAHSGEIMLTLLDESQNNNKQKMRQNSRELPFSSGYIEFETKSHAFLKNRPVVFVSYCSWTNIKILTVHGRNEILNEYSNSLICSWSLLNTDEPERVFIVPGDLTCCCFVSKWKGLVFGGLHDGLISIWDNRNYDKMKFEKEEFQRPNYITEIDNGHSGRIVSIQSLIDSTEELNNSNFNWKQFKDQICSLDENGTLIVWSVISRKPNLKSVLADQTITPWSNVCLVQNLKFSLRELNPDLTDLHCNDMNINVINPNHIFISTNYGHILHCLVSGGKVNPKKYKRDQLSQSNCLEFCPFSPLYFFAGHEDGTIVLYSTLLEKPLMTMSNKDTHEQSGIHLLQWSYQKPCVFYAKDRNNTLHLWDLSISDLFPIYSVPFRENITCMKLSPILVKNNDISYMVLVTESGTVHLHVLNAEYGPSNLLQYQQDVKKFLNYVNRL